MPILFPAVCGLSAAEEPLIRCLQKDITTGKQARYQNKSRAMMTVGNPVESRNG